ncbi:MAG: MFS transporter [Anaerolineales bacterium]|nr:MFS transporter [Anaerolineales bacterium]
MTSTSAIAKNPPVSVARLLALALLTRLFTDTSLQIFFPFLPILAAGLGTTPIVLGRLLSVQSALGLLLPLLGSWADRVGYRRVMRLGLLSGSAGFALLAASQGLGLAVAGLILAGLGTVTFNPILQAYMSAWLPYHQRGRGLGILEYSWALSGIVGLYLVGRLLEVASWRVPMLIFSGGMLVAFFVYRWLPTVPRAEREQTAVSPLTPPSHWQQRLQTFLDLGENGRSAWANVLITCLLRLAGFNLFIVYGTWLAADYGLGAGELGRMALFLGTADLCGSGLVSLISDRLGKRTSALIGFTLIIIGLVLLLQPGDSLQSALLRLIVVRFGFEFSVVSHMTLVSEQSPQQRGKTITLAGASGRLGGTLAALTGPWLVATGGIFYTASFSLLVIIPCWLLLFWLGREPE